MRIVVSLLATLALYMELLITLLVFMESSGEDLKTLLSALFVPLAFFSLQIPQWVLKFATGANMVPHAQVLPAHAGARRFTLAQLLGATAAVAASLAAARLGISLIDPYADSTGGTAFVTLVLLGAGCNVGLLLCVPCTWAVLIARDMFRGIVALTANGAFLCLAFCGVMLASASFRPDPAELGWLVLFALALVGATLVCLSVSLAGMRSAGYRIRKVGKPPKQAVAD